MKRDWQLKPSVYIERAKRRAVNEVLGKVGCCFLCERGVRLLGQGCTSSVRSAEGEQYRKGAACGAAAPRYC